MILLNIGKPSYSNVFLKVNVTSQTVTLDPIQNIVTDDDNVDDFCHVVYSIINDSPIDVYEAKKSSEWPKWRKTMQAEVDAINKAEAWSILTRTSNVKVITSRWVFKVKEDIYSNIFYKAHFVARGCQLLNNLSYGEVYALVAKLSTVRLLISVSLFNSMLIHTLDIKNAFLNGEFTDDIYLEIPEGLTKGNVVLKLNKALYGLAQALLAWNKKFNETLLWSWVLKGAFMMSVCILGN